MMAEIKLKLHEKVIIVSGESRDGFHPKDLVVYTLEENMEEKIKRLSDLAADANYMVTGVEGGFGVDIGVLIAEMGKLFKKAQNYYYKLEERNKIQNNLGLDEFFPVVVITFYILKQIKIILKSMALGNIANEIEKNELNIAWDLFQYLLKGMPLGPELLNKVNKDKFMEDYAKVYILR